ncbi:FecR domain-containing protein [Myxococcus qinghaiensis]|uniref:FecR domain-containing protein n=1 Tax=Myxococcus qinghaiensis TaxID=2906758 RepID=UPI0020A72CA8|nr:FecR domain-containing protein [Myxococcus qinghaiensis]MCP3167630.1 FecR domain-containing protein [Myxococcus qinghaiensis]
MAHPEERALWALVADELSAEETASTRAHLSSCATCSAELERVRTSRAMLHEVRSVEPQVNWDAVGAKLRAEAAARLEAKSSRMRWPWSTANARGSDESRRPGSELHARQEGKSPSAWPNVSTATARRTQRWPWALALAGTCAVVLALWVSRATVAPTSTPPPEAVRAEQTAPTPEAAVAVGPPATTAEQESTRAESTTGAVIRERGGAEQALRAGMRLRSGTAVKTPSRASAMLRLPDASRVRLSADSEVELSRAEASDVHLTVRQGRLSVQASHAERRGFRVDVAGLRVSVVGTVFTVARTLLGASVAVSEGRVRVEQEGHPARMVGAGERVELFEEQDALYQAPLSVPDREALEAMDLPTESSTQEVGPTVPTGASTPEAAPTVVPAVAHVPQTPSTVKPALAKEPLKNVERKSNVVTASLKPRQEKAQTPPATAEKTPVEPTSPPPGLVAMATPPAASTARTPADPSQEFAPYPAPSVTEKLPATPLPAPVVTAPSPAPQQPVQVAELPEPKKKKGGLSPMSLLSKDADERFLGYARIQEGPRTCESFLAGLEEIAAKSPRKDHREQARYLRARCFEARLQGQDAKTEYRQYLNDFPRGRYVREAGAALLP